MVGKDGKIINIDNDDALMYTPQQAEYPGHFNDITNEVGESVEGIGKDLMHIDAINWLSTLDPRELASQMMLTGIDKNKTKEAVRRLRVLQSLASGTNLFGLHDAIYPKNHKVAE